MHVLSKICNYVFVWGIIMAPLVLYSFKSLYGGYFLAFILF